MNIDELVKQHKIIPVLTQNDPDLAVKIVEALAAGGILCVEVALRTPNSIRVIEALSRALPQVCVGAGTLRDPNDFSRVQQAGAQFAVSPGATHALLVEAENWDLPYLPAASTVSEILALQDRGYSTIKLFPAGQLGGIAYIKAISAPLTDVLFVPSGGVDSNNLGDYLALPQVASVSGSWMMPADAIECNDWQCLTQLARTGLQSISSKE